MMKNMILAIITILLTQVQVFALEDTFVDGVRPLKEADVMHTKYTEKVFKFYKGMDQKVYLLNRQNWVNAKTRYDYNMLTLKMWADYAYTKLENNPADPAMRALLAESLDSLKDDYLLDYSPKNITPQLPNVDAAKGSYTMPNGKTFNLLDKIIDTRGFLNCTFNTLNPRKLVIGPGCAQEGTRICTGYVDCINSKGIRSSRPAICSEKNCEDDKASLCAAEKPYEFNKVISSRTGNSKDGGSAGSTKH